MRHRSTPQRAPGLVALLALAAWLPALAAAASAAGAHAWDGTGTPAELDAWVQQRLQGADAALARLLAAKGPRTIENTLQPYDEAFGAIVDAICHRPES
jgi:thimet oligopeptidase